MLAFLCGGMEYSPDGGRQWREPMRLWLAGTLKHRVYDPTEEARRLLSPQELDNLFAWKTANSQRFRKVMRRIIHHDLDVMAEQADYVICLWDEAAALGAGTQGELTAAFRKGIPVYLVTVMPVGEISGWVFGCTEKIFPGFEELKAFLISTYGREARR